MPSCRSSIVHLGRWARPRPTSAFIGRDAAREDLVRALTDDLTRLVSVTGPGGVGKSRLALEAAGQAAAHFADGAAFVPLAEHRQPELVIQAIAASLGLVEIEGRPVDLAPRLVDYELLLVLDSFEHLMQAAATVADLLAACPRLTILITTRVPLRVEGERHVVLAPLDPVTEAKALFLARASDSARGRALTASDEEVVERICLRLDGLPLAVELAAARLNLLAPEEILDRLDERFGLLTGGARDRPQHQRSLDAAIAWSYDLLDEQVRGLFRSMAVFAASFTVADAEAIASGAPAQEGTAERGRAADAVAILDGLASLLDNSLLMQRPGGDRLIMLESIREYGRRRLVDAGEDGAVAAVHADHFGGLARRAGEALLAADREPTMRALTESDEEIRAVLRQSLDAGDHETALEVAAGLTWFWYHSGRLSEGSIWLKEVLATPGDPSRARVRAITGAARILRYRLKIGASLRLAEEGVAMARQLGDRRELGYALQALGLAVQAVQAMQADPSVPRTSTDVLAEAVSVMRTTDDEWGLALARFYLGAFAVFTGEDERVLAALPEAEAFYRGVADLWGVGGVLFYRGLFAARHDRPEARALIGESVELMRASGDRWRLNTALDGLAAMVEADGEDATAYRKEAADLRAALGIPNVG